MRNAVRHLLVDTKEKQKCRRAEAGNDEAESPKESADEPSDEIRLDCKFENALEEVKYRGDRDKADNKRQNREFISLLFSRLAPQLGKRSCNKSDKNAKYDIFIPLQELFSYARKSDKAEDTAYTNEDEHLEMLSDTLEWIRKNLEYLVINSEGVTKRSAADSGEDRAESDYETLYHPKYCFKYKILFHFSDSLD